MTQPIEHLLTRGAELLAYYVEKNPTLSVHQIVQLLASEGCASISRGHFNTAGSELAAALQALSVRPE